jgi:hypothetical protein
MITTLDQLQQAIIALHGYLVRTHWNGAALVGPDSGVRWNFRLGRFIKSYLPLLPWPDTYAFMQTQTYWILANWLLAEVAGEAQAHEMALACADYLVRTQQPEGFWLYPPLPSRVGKIATVEGNFATIGLLATFQRTREASLLKAGKRWHHFLTQDIGFQADQGVMAVNYWANSTETSVPNNTTLTLWTLAELAAATNDRQYLADKTEMLAFLRQVQLASGELPYEVGRGHATGRPHFLCYQYNAFEFLDLCHYYHKTGDEAVLSILNQLAQFLSSGVTESGAARYNCQQVKPETVYYTAAVATALGQAEALGLGDFRHLADRAYARVLTLQKADGGMAFFSAGNYGFLSDRRSYPRNLVMILYHLLLELRTQIVYA